MKEINNIIYPQKTFQQLLLGAVTALLFSAFIYLADFGLEIKLLNTINALVAFWLLLHTPKKAVLFAGFFIGILWSVYLLLQTNPTFAHSCFLLFHLSLRWILIGCN